MRSLNINRSYECRKKNDLTNVSCGPQVEFSRPSIVHEVSFVLHTFGVCHGALEIWLNVLYGETLHSEVVHRSVSDLEHQVSNQQRANKRYSCVA